MKLIEFDGKTLLKSAGIEVPASIWLEAESTSLPEGVDWSKEWFLKAQVLSGRRGKNGLVRRCQSQEEALPYMAEMRQQLAQIPCAGFLLEQAVSHEEEWFVSLDVDRETGRRRIHLSSQGGGSVAQAEMFLFQDQNDIASLTVTEQMRAILGKLLELFSSQDLLSAEINPLIFLPDGMACALDAKIELDDAAIFRHADWLRFHRLSPLGRPFSPREQAYTELLETSGHRGTLGRYVELDGNVAMILSGGGASLAAMDALLTARAKPANYVEMSGNPEPEIVRQAARIVLSHPSIKAIWVAGSFANFTDIQSTVMAVLAAYDDLHLRVPIVIRRDGPHTEEARQLAQEWAMDRNVSLSFHRADADFEFSASVLVMQMTAYRSIHV